MILIACPVGLWASRNHGRCAFASSGLVLPFDGSGAPRNRRRSEPFRPGVLGRRARIQEMTTEKETVTRLLQQWNAGDKAALDELMPVVYDQLRRLAGACLRNERTDHTLRATALVNEAYLRLVDAQVK